MHFPILKECLHTAKTRVLMPPLYEGTKKSFSWLPTLMVARTFPQLAVLLESEGRRSLLIHITVTQLCLCLLQLEGASSIFLVINISSPNLSLITACKWYPNLPRPCSFSGFLSTAAFGVRKSPAQYHQHSVLCTLSAVHI